MNVHDELSDNEVLRAASTSLSALPLASAPELDTILARGRAHRRRRLAMSALPVAAVGTVLALGVTGVLSPAPARSTGTIQTASFTLASNANGTDTLTINVDEMLDAAALQRDLQHDGIPAKVTSGSFCSSDPEPAIGPGSPVSQVVDADGYHQITINPAAIPAGDELSFGIFPLRGSAADFFNLMNTSSYTCTSTPPGTSMMIAGFGTDHQSSGHGHFVLKSR
jgi:hypothetical protein